MDGLLEARAFGWPLTIVVVVHLVIGVLMGNVLQRLPLGVSGCCVSGVFLVIKETALHA